MDKFKRIFVIVADSLGVGELPDAGKYNDTGANTLGHIANKYVKLIKEFAAKLVREE